MKRGVTIRAVMVAVVCLIVSSTQSKASDWWYDYAIDLWYEMVNEYNAANYYYSIGDTGSGDYWATNVIGTVNTIEWDVGYGCSWLFEDGGGIGYEGQEQIDECNYLYYVILPAALPYRDWAYNVIWGG